MKKSLILAALSFIFISSTAFAQEVSTLRDAPLDQEAEAPMILPIENNDIKRVRNYPEQPPTIPHKITGYQVDQKANKCMSCHSRKATEISQAPMISITHFMNRENQFLASVSPRRYFCTQCHVPQSESKPLVENTFVDVDDVLDADDSDGN